MRTEDRNLNGEKIVCSRDGAKMPVGSVNSSTCLTKKREPNVGNRIGQKTAEGHLGNNKTPPALEISRCKMV